MQVSPLAFIAFFAGMVLSLCGTAFGVIQWRLRRREQLCSSHRLRMLAAAGHSLRQPVHALNLYLGTLAEMPLGTHAATVLKGARQCGKVADQMFRAMLDLSRLDAGLVQPQMTCVDIRQLLEKVREQFIAEASDKGLCFELDCPPLWAQTDPVIAERVLSNLTINAIQYTRRGTVRLSAWRRRSGTVRLVVRDTGPGIPRAEREAIFQEYYRGQAGLRDDRGGLGLGLSIARRLARALQSEIVIKSKQGAGSVFAIDLPYRPPPRAQGIENHASSVDWHSNELLVAIVDDDPSVLRATRMLLEQWHCVAVTASTGDDILRLLREFSHPPDVLLCDYRLQDEQSGAEVIEMVRNAYGMTIPAMLLTGDTAALPLEAEKLPIMHKPLAADQLHEALAALVASRPR